MRILIYLTVVIGVAALLWSQEQASVSTGGVMEQRGPAPSKGDPIAATGRISAIMISNRYLIVGDQHGRIQIFRQPSGQLESQWYGHTGPVRSLIGRANRFYSVSEDGSVAEWSYGGDPMGRVRLSGHHLNSAVILPDGGIIVGGDKGIVARIDAGSQWHANGIHGRATFALALSPDGDSVASAGSDGRIRIWSLGQGQELASWAAHKQWVSALVWSEDGLWSAGTDGTVRRWGPEGEALGAAFKSTGDEIHYFSMTDDHIAIAGPEQQVIIMDRATGKTLRVIPTPGLTIHSIHLLAGRLYTGHGESLVSIWSVTNGKQIATVPTHR